jgi:hypothetical protein
LGAAAQSTPPTDAEVVFKNSGANAILLELYSSEGCSSCPPAEAWISRLKDSPGLWRTVFPVVFHVDYWDGLGWSDRFAQPTYTDRQRTYAARLGQESVYTPEVIANAREWRDWYQGRRSSAVTPAVAGGELSLQLQDGGNSVSVKYFPSTAALARNYTAEVALLGSNIHSDVRRGENAGHRLSHDFVVLGFRSKRLTKKESYESGAITLKPTTNDVPSAVVGWISAPDGKILQVAGGWLALPPT